MIAVNTNALVPILADDPDQPAQVEAARAFATEAAPVFVPLSVQVETVWILESGYDLSKESILQALEHLQLNQAFVFPDADPCQRALELFRSANADDSDCLILSEGQRRGLTLHAFDKRLSTLTGVNRVQTQT